MGIKKLLLPILVLSALVTEAYLLLGGKRDSWFFDSMLNAHGQKQAQVSSEPHRTACVAWGQVCTRTDDTVGFWPLKPVPCVTMSEHQHHHPLLLPCRLLSAPVQWLREHLKDGDPAKIADKHGPPPPPPPPPHLHNRALHMDLLSSCRSLPWCRGAVVLI
eukprot:SAG11_NODE_2224_length_3666_cov_2.269975_5_plen_161_part_00